MASKLALAQGDTDEWPTITIKENGSAVDLSSATQAELYMWKVGSESNKIDGSTATIAADQGANTGELTYDPQAADMDTSGEFRLEIEITWNDGDTTTWPNDSPIAVTIRETRD